MRVLRVVSVAAVLVVAPAVAIADQSSQPGDPAAGQLTAGRFHTCAVLSGDARCWGFSGNGQLGRGDTETIGDDETPGAVGAVNVGTGRKVTAIAAGEYHTCALLDDGEVRCWGYGVNGRLGYGNVDSVGDDEAPGSVGPVDLGPDRTATAIAAGDAHSCTILDDGNVRCWGFNDDGRLGTGTRSPDPAKPCANVCIGDDETPGSIAPVDLGAGHTATAIAAGGRHTCAIRDDGGVLCWGYGAQGQLGYANARPLEGRPCAGLTCIGDDETPGSVGPVDLGPGRTALAIAAGTSHTCAILDTGAVRCWGFGGNGQLGYAGTANVGDDETPIAEDPVQLGGGARAIAADGDHTCAVLDAGAVRCWGLGSFGRLGYGNADTVGDDETPASAGPVDLGPGRTARAVALGLLHTCALLDDGNVRCWGNGDNGRLGYCNPAGRPHVGDDEPPGSVGPVSFAPGNAGCPAPAVTPTPTPTPTPDPTPAQSPSPLIPSPDPLAVEASRAKAMRRCLAAAKRRPARRRARARRACLKRHGRTPGRISGLTARAVSRTKVVLSFAAPGSDGGHPPAARTYLVKQSLRPIRTARDFRRADGLCRGRCRFDVMAVGTRLELTITGLRRRTAYSYAVAARDNVSGRLGPRSASVEVRTR